MRKCIALLTGSILFAATAAPAFAGSFENGVRNRWENRQGTYRETTELQIDGRSDYQYDVEIEEWQYSLKIDLVAPHANLDVEYWNDTDDNESDIGGGVKVRGRGSTSPIDPDPTFMLVEKGTHTNISGTESGYDNYQGTFFSEEQGSVQSGYVEASGFLNF